MCLILLVIIGAGAFGGIVNHFLSKPDQVPPPHLVRSVVMGLAASFLVPLFLNMISSNLIDLIKGGDNTKLLILLGFCLVAAISSTAFIRTLSDRILTEARQATHTAQEAKDAVIKVRDDVQPIVSRETEPAAVLGTSSKPEASTPSSEEARLLTALAEGKWTLRTEGGLAKETGIDRAAVLRLLNELRSRGLVDRRVSESGTRWFITDAARFVRGG